MTMRALQRFVDLRLAAVVVLSLAVAAATPLRVAESPVADAAEQNDVEAVRALLRRGADPNAPQSDGLTALHWAALRDNAQLVEVLRYAGANLRPLTRAGGYTPLHLAAREGHVAVARALLSAGASPDVMTATGVTALHFAAMANAPELVNALVEHGADLNVPDAYQGRTPLIFAASGDAVDAISALLVAGADPSAQTDLKDYTKRSERDDDEQARRTRVRRAQSGEPPAEGRGGRGGPPQQAQQAQQGRGAATPDTTGAEPDTTAAEPDTTGAEPDTTAAEPDTAAAEPAAEEEEAEEEEKADEKPAEPPVRALSSDEQIGVQGGFSALHYAARQGHVESARRLLDGGADVDQPSGGDQSTPLLVAVINGNYDLAMMLLERGADPNLVSDDGAGPLFATLNIEWSLRTWYPQPQMFRSQRTSYLELMEALMKAGADVNQPTSTHIWYAAYNAGRMGVDFTGATPFWRAAYAADVKAMRLLIAYGADPNVWTVKLPNRRFFGDPPNQTNRDPDDEEEEEDPSGLPPVPIGGPAVHPMHAAAGVGFGTSRVAQQHRSVPGGFLESMKYFVEELGIDPNLRDHDGYAPLHHAAARGDNATILYLVEQGADPTLIARSGQTTADMANSPEQRAQPYPETIALLEKLGSRNNHRCQSCGQSN
jgi:ankyrin repeat protein